MNEFNGEIVLILILKLTVERFLHNSEWFLRNFALYNKQLKFTWIDMQSILQSISISALPLVLWHCWLGGRKGIRHIKTEWWGTGVVIYLEQGENDLHMVQLMPLPPHHLLLQ